MELYKLRYNLYNYLIKDNFDYNSSKEYLDLWKNSLVILFSFIILVFVGHLNEFNLLSLIIILFILIFVYIIYYSIKDVINKYESNKYLNDYNNYFNLINVMFIESYDFTEDNETNNPNYQDESTIIKEAKDLIKKTDILTNSTENLEKYNAYIEGSNLYLKTNLEISDLQTQLIEFDRSDIKRNNDINDIFITNSLIYNNLYYNQFNKDSKYSLTSNSLWYLNIKLDTLNNDYDKNILLNSYLLNTGNINTDTKIISFNDVTAYNDINDNREYLKNTSSFNNLNIANLLSLNETNNYYFMNFDIRYLNEIDKYLYLNQLLSLNNTSKFIKYNNYKKDGYTLLILPDTIINTINDIPFFINKTDKNINIEEFKANNYNYITRELKLNYRIEGYINKRGSNFISQPINRQIEKLIDGLIKYYIYIKDTGKILENNYIIKLSFDLLKENKNNEKFRVLLSNILKDENDYKKLNANIFKFNSYNNNTTTYNYPYYIEDTTISIDNIFDSNSSLYRNLILNNDNNDKMYSIHNNNSQDYLKIKLKNNNLIHNKYLNSNIDNIINFKEGNTNNFYINDINLFITNYNLSFVNYTDEYIKNNCLKNINFIKTAQTLLNDKYIKIIDYPFCIINDVKKDCINITAEHLYFSFNLSYLNEQARKSYLASILSLKIQYIYYDDNQPSDDITEKSAKSLLIYPDENVSFRNKQYLYNEKLIKFDELIYPSFSNLANFTYEYFDYDTYLTDIPANLTIRVILNIASNRELAEALKINYNKGKKQITDRIIKLFRGFVDFYRYKTGIDNDILVKRPEKNYNLLFKLADIKENKENSNIIQTILNDITENEKRYIKDNKLIYTSTIVPEIIPKLELYIKLNAVNLEENYLKQFPKLRLLLKILINNYNENNKNKRKNTFMEEIYTLSHTNNINTYLASYFSLKKRIKQNIKYNDDKTDDEINNIEYKKTFNNKDILKYIDIYNDKDLLFIKDFLFIRTDKNKTGNDFYDIIKGIDNRKLFLKHSNEIDTNDLMKKIDYPLNNTNTDYYLINMKAMHNLLESYDFGFMPKFIEYINKKYNLNVKNIDILYKIPELNQNTEILKIVDDFNYEYIKIVIVIIVIITIIMNVFYREYIRFIR